MVSIQPVSVTTSPPKVTIGVPHRSVAVTNVISAAGTVPLHAGNVIPVGHVIVGGVASTVRVMVCVQLAVLPHGSVARYVLVVVSIQPDTLTTSLTNEIVAVPHASVADTDVISATGTEALHPGKVTFAGHVIAGGAVSTVRVIIWEQLDVFPHASVAI